MVEPVVPIREALWAEATARLAAAGVAEPRREALAIAGELADGVAALLLGRDAEVDPAWAERYLLAIARRAAGEPRAYVTGSIGFRTLDLLVDRRVLIPRPETERLVEVALARVRDGVAVDVGTGSGAIALSLAAEGAFSEVIGIDRSPGALEVARANADRSGRRVTWMEGDLLAPLAGRTVDLLVSNPPYLTEAEHDALEPAVRDWEPPMALRGGADGLDPYRRLLAGGGAVLRRGGWLALEVDARRAGATADLAMAHRWCAVTVLDDLFGRARYLVARWEG